MQIEMNETEYCKVDVHYEADIEAVLAKRSEVVGKFKDATVPGFRQGHASPEVLKIYFRKEIDDALKRELANEAAQNTVYEKKIKPFGHPQFKAVNLEGNKFSCDFSLHVQPDFELKQYKEFEIPKPVEKISAPELAQRILQDLRVRYGETTQYGENDFVQIGDNVVIDYNGTVDDQPVDRLTASGELVQVGKTPIPGFDDNLLGMKAGEERVFVLNMPDSVADSLAGKAVHFKVKLVLGSKIQPAPLDDSLAKKVGFEDFQTMMNHASTTASSRVQETTKNEIMDQITRRLVSGHDFKIPHWISSAEAQMVAKNNGENWEVLSDTQKEKYLEHADNSIKLSLILSKVRDTEPEAQLTDEEVFKVAKENISKFSNNPDEVFEGIFKNGHLPLLFNRIRDEHTIAFIQKYCTIVE